MFAIRRVAVHATPSRAYRCAPSFIKPVVVVTRLYSTPASNTGASAQPAAATSAASTSGAEIDANSADKPAATGASEQLAAETSATNSTDEPATVSASPAQPPASKPAAYPPFKPFAKPATKPTARSAAKPAARPVVKPASEAASASTTSLPEYKAPSPTFTSRAYRGERTEDVDWSTSYKGVSMQPILGDQHRVLLAPVNEDDIEVKPDGVIYLPEVKYRRRLNEVFGPGGWGLIPRGEAVVGSNIVTREYALIVAGRFISQAQGENSYYSPEQLPAAVEGCKSNALMRCCKDLGIASELWDPRFVRAFRKDKMEEVWVVHGATNKKRVMWFRKGQVDITYPWKRV